MTKKDLFRIIIKIVGLITLVRIIIQIPSLIFFLILELNNGIDWMGLLVPISEVLMTLALLYKSDEIINGLKLDQQFDNDQVLMKGLDGKGLTKIALIVIGVYLITANLGPFFTQIILIFGDSVKTHQSMDSFDLFMTRPIDYTSMFNAAFCLIVGFLLLTNQAKVAQWLEKLNRKNDNQMLDGKGYDEKRE